MAVNTFLLFFFFKNNEDYYYTGENVQICLKENLSIDFHAALNLFLPSYVISSISKSTKYCIVVY